MRQAHYLPGTAEGADSLISTVLCFGWHDLLCLQYALESVPLFFYGSNSGCAYSGRYLRRIDPSLSLILLESTWSEDSLQTVACVGYAYYQFAIMIKVELQG
jgi:hypothetical protein